MLRRSIAVLTLALTNLASAQFGNANINWGSEASPAVVVNNEEPLRDIRNPAPSGVRQTGLASLQAAELEDILAGFGLSRLGTTNAHMISQIRAACLGLAPKALKAQLATRGLRCDGCAHREAYLDRLLDSVHIAPKRK